MSAVIPTARPGLYRVTHGASGRSALGFSMNVDALLNRTRSELQTGTHHHAALQRDWKEAGSEAFTCEVLDTPIPGGATPATLRDDLQEPLTLWQATPDLPPACRY